MPPCTIDSRHPSFKNGAKDAAKRHRSFAASLALILEQIEKEPMAVGDQIKCSDPTAHVRKARIGCPKENVPPRAGYRLIFQVVTNENGTRIARLLDCYYKQRQADIEPDAVARLIKLVPSTDEEPPTST